uniref:Synaptophysin n=1 Tax=Neogobius melanostomus TaxID=47308 RepID=A0A8C6TCK0_9GOBI
MQAGGACRRCSTPPCLSGGHPCPERAAPLPPSRVPTWCHFVSSPSLSVPPRVCNLLPCSSQRSFLVFGLGLRLRLLSWLSLPLLPRQGGPLRVAARRPSCPDLDIDVEFEYPSVRHLSVICTLRPPNTERYFLVGDYSSSAEFFVTIGVFAFLYSMAALSVYVFFFEKYKENNKGPLIDLGVTAFFAFMWLVSAAAWAKGLSDVKTATDPDEVMTLIQAYACVIQTLIFSYLQAFGFINLILWAGNLWFVFKETGIIAPFMRAPPPQTKPEEAYGSCQKLYIGIIADF